MTIQVKPRNPMSPFVLRELAEDLERETGEDVHILEVRGFTALEVIDLVIDNTAQVAAVAFAFSAWRRQRRSKEDGEPPIKGVIYGPDGEVLREIPDDD
jgi:hypothetical protein